MGSEFHLDFSLLQCQDLLSQTSSPLSQNDSCTGRSSDLLLPPGDTGRRRHDCLHDPAAPSRAERFRIQVGQEEGCGQGSPHSSGQDRASQTPALPLCQHREQEEDTSLLPAFPTQPGTCQVQSPSFPCCDCMTHSSCRC